LYHDYADNEEAGAKRSWWNTCPFEQETTSKYQTGIKERKKHLE
jgi:hypothetical protein